MALAALLAELLAVVAEPEVLDEDAAELSPLLEVVRTLPRAALSEEAVCCVA